MKPLVSVIVPNYNHAAFLKQRMESILTQTYTHIEVILLDDGSTDDSRQILEGFQYHPLVKTVLFNKTNSGASAYRQWQKGFEVCVGEWVWIAESDDWCEPSFLETLIASVTSKCSLAFVQSMAVQEEHILWSSSHPQLLQVVHGRNFISNSMIAGNAVFNASMAVFRKAALQTISYDFSQLRFLGDWAFWSGIAAAGDVHICGKVLNYFRQNSSGVSAIAKKNGGLYAEYPQLMDWMFAQGWITNGQRQDAINTMFQRLLSDDAISVEEKKKIESQYESLVPVAEMKTRWRWQQFKRSISRSISG